jgi:hypothetical protein
MAHSPNEKPTTFRMVDTTIPSTETNRRGFFRAAATVTGILAVPSIFGVGAAWNFLTSGPKKIDEHLKITPYNICNFEHEQSQEALNIRNLYGEATISGKDENFKKFTDSLQKLNTNDLKDSILGALLVYGMHTKDEGFISNIMAHCPTAQYIGYYADKNIEAAPSINCSSMRDILTASQNNSEISNIVGNWNGDEIDSLMAKISAKIKEVESKKTSAVQSPG